MDLRAKTLTPLNQRGTPTRLSGGPRGGKLVKPAAAQQRLMSVNSLWWDNLSVVLVMTRCNAGHRCNTTCGHQLCDV